MKGFKIIKTNTGGDEIKRDIDILNFVYDSEVVRNNIEARCQIIRGELSYNTMLGIGLRSDKDTKDLDISSIINTTGGVRQILLFNSGLVNTKYNAQINVETTYNTNVEVSL